MDFPLKLLLLLLLLGIENLDKEFVFALEIDSIFEINPVHSIGKISVAIIQSIAIYFRISLKSLSKYAQRQTRAPQILYRYLYFHVYFPF